jgi:hypothetical protein
MLENAFATFERSTRISAILIFSRDTTLWTWIGGFILQVSAAGQISASF